MELKQLVQNYDINLLKDTIYVELTNLDELVKTFTDEIAYEENTGV